MEDTTKKNTMGEWKKTLPMPITNIELKIGICKENRGPKKVFELANKAQLDS